MNQINCEVVRDRALNFAMYNNDVPLIKSIALTNGTEETISNVELQIRKY